MNLRIGLLAAAAFVSVAGAASAGTLTPIASYVDPAGGSTTVIDINNAGWMTGSITEPDGTTLGFSRNAAGVYSTFSVGVNTFGRAIDNNNAISGYATDATQNMRTDQEFVRSAGGGVTILQNPGTGVDLHGIAQNQNAAGAIVGDNFSGPAGNTTPQLGYILDGGTLTTLAGLPGATRVAARGIEDDGTVAGWMIVGGVEQGFIYTGGTYSLFSDPSAGAVSTTFEDINNNGLVAGNWTDVDGVSHAFQFNSFFDVFTEITVDGATNVQAFGLNDAGDEVITTDLAQGPNNFIYNAAGVPEPATWALMLVGFFGLGSALRRRRAAALAA